MKYNSFSIKYVDKLWNLFSKHNNYVNEKYNKLIGTPEDHVGLSDRDRFTARYFHGLKDKCVVFIDRKLVATKYIPNNTYYFNNSFLSIYSYEYYKRSEYRSKDILSIPRKVYVNIKSIVCENEFNGIGSYIKISGLDVTGKSISIRIDRYNLCNLQWRFISTNEFMDIANLFIDDRDDETYIGHKRMQFEEMINISNSIKNKKDREKLLSDLSKKVYPVTIKAKGLIEAKKIIEDENINILDLDKSE